LNDPLLERLLSALQPVGGLVALVLGGSRACGTSGPSSDYDLGLYYEASAPLNTEQLQDFVRPLLDNSGAGTVTSLGGWGPWINGGAWLTVSGRKVDLLYRDLTQVRSVINDCKAGRLSMNYQPGHPHGFCSAIWMGEVALCRPLLDPTGAMSDLKSQTSPFPGALREALIARFHWEVLFSIEIAEIAAGRGEKTHIAGCVYRALCCVAQVLFAVNGRYLINEKGALAEAATLPVTIEALDQAVDDIWVAVGMTDFGSAVRLLREIARCLDNLVLNFRSKTSFQND
jgi:hypothetical protein